MSWKLLAVNVSQNVITMSPSRSPAQRPDADDVLGVLFRQR